MLVGVSAGGIAAVYAAYRYPEVFGNVLSQSGSVGWTPPQPGPKAPDFSPEPGWIAKQFQLGRGPRLPIPFFLELPDWMEN